jgi:hypothetical protein
MGTSLERPPALSLTLSTRADPNERSRLWVMNIKGRAEVSLLSLASSTTILEIFNVRPSWVDGPIIFPRKKDAGWGWKKAAEGIAGPVIRQWGKKGWRSPVGVLARAVEKIVVGGPEERDGVERIEGGWTVGPEAIWRLAGVE